MGKVIADLGLSLDGYMAGPNASPSNPMGGVAERLHGWALETASFRERQGDEGGVRNRDDEIGRETYERAGAYLVGRRMFDEGEVAWPNPSPFRKPVFVVTHRPREPWVQSEMTFTFVTDGLHSAVEQAREAAGDRDVMVHGGAETLRQLINAGLIDEMQIHLAPVLLGEGLRLYDGIDGAKVEFEPTRVIESSRVTHITYDLHYA